MRATEAQRVGAYAQRAPTSVDWMRDANCLDTDLDLWFPSRTDDPRQALALALCAECPVRDLCAEWGREPLAAGVNHDYGIYGGRPVPARKKRTSPVLRVEKCRHGHDYGPENTYTDSRGWRSCRTCTKWRKRLKRYIERNTA